MRKKRSSWKCLTSVLALSLGITLSALPSCRSVSSVESLMSNVENQEVHDSHLSTFDIQHSALRDSIIYRERTIHDTVFVTKEVYRNQRLSTFDLQHSTKADTVVVTEYRDKIIEHPPERYVPAFYRRCTIAFWAILLLAIGYWALRWWLKRRG